MIKGSFIFAGGLAVGTGYGFLLGLRLSKALQAVAEQAASQQVVEGQVVDEQPQAASA